MKTGMCPDFPVYPNDWLSSTHITLMSPSEEGGYFRLLCHAWADPDCCLPDDDEALAMLSRLGAAWRDGSGARIRACFDVDDDRPGSIFNAKQRSVRRAQAARVKVAEDKCRTMRDAKAQKDCSLKGSYKGSYKEPLEEAPKALSSPVSRLPSPNKDIPTSAKAKVGHPSSDHQQTIKLWCEFYKSIVKANYAVTAKDGSAVKAMLKSGMTPEGIISLARKAQTLNDKFLTAQAITLPGLSGSLNSIRAALTADGGGGTKLPTKATKSEAEMVSQFELDALAKQRGAK